jgi:hypothetical protein
MERRGHDSIGRFSALDVIESSAPARSKGAFAIVATFNSQQTLRMPGSRATAICSPGLRPRSAESMRTCFIPPPLNGTRLIPCFLPIPCFDALKTCRCWRTLTNQRGPHRCQEVLILQELLDGFEEGREHPRMGAKEAAGSPGWIRTSDHSINSQPLFHFAALHGISQGSTCLLFH